MTVQRGEVVIVDFSNTDPNAGVRPALVVQNDQDNQSLAKTIVLQITTNLRRAGHDAHYLLGQQHPDFANSGLRAPSLISASNIATVAQVDVTRRIGSLSEQTIQDIDECLKAALGIV